MNGLEGVIATLDYLLGTKRKRHIVGGILMSASLLFAGLAFTALTLKIDNDEELDELEEEREDEQYIE